MTDSNLQRRERQRRLALETIDLTKDPYFFKNHLGSYECRLFLTLHMNAGSHLAHTQGKKHQVNLQRRISREAKQGLIHQEVKRKAKRNHHIMKIGRPGYKVIKVGLTRTRSTRPARRRSSSRSSTRRFLRAPSPPTAF